MVAGKDPHGGVVAGVVGVPAKAAFVVVEFVSGGGGEYVFGEEGVLGGAEDGVGHGREIGLGHKLELDWSLIDVCEVGLVEVWLDDEGGDDISRKAGRLL